MMTKNYETMMKEMMDDGSDEDSFGTDLSYLQSRGASAFTNERNKKSEKVSKNEGGPKIMEPPDLFNDPSR
jgi:hypothetical protein